MASVLASAMDMIERFDGETTAAGSARQFFADLEPWGLRALYARAYPVHSHAAATEYAAAHQHVYARVSPDGWEDAYARLQLERNNPTIRGFLTSHRGFSWDQIGLLQEGRRWAGWDCLGDFNIEGGFGIPCHGPGGYRAGVSLGFESLDLSPRQRQAIELASVALHDRMRALSPVRQTEAPPQLTGRERDCIAFVAEGKSDWEIGVILGVCQATAHTHVENAKRKLGAKSRPQAVARAVRLGIV